MELFGINISFRIITPSSEDGKLLVLLDDNGSFPQLLLGKEPCIEEQIYQKLSEIFYTSDLNIVYQTKQISSIINEDSIITILYTFISPSTASKTGSFVNFDKNSLELYRLVNNKSL